MKIYQKRKRKNIVKQKLEKGLYLILMLLGLFTCLNYFVDYLSSVDWFDPKTIEFLKEEKVSASYVDSLVPAGELPYVETGGEKISASSIEEEIKEVFGEEDYPVARSIMLAESGGVADRVGDTHLRKPSIGLFQISQLYHDYPTEVLKNPSENIRIAKEIKDRGGWERWTTYRNGAYLKYIN